MRWRDLLALALSALAQQRLRTLLTTLGIVFGTVVLASSVALRRGVESTITHEHARYHELRQIEVRPGRPAASAEPVEVRGQMSDERRQRLRRELTRRLAHLRDLPPEARLTPARLEEVRAIPHVVSVRPLVLLRGRAILGERVESTTALGVPPDDEPFRDRLIAGTLLDRSDGNDALVTEHLLYQLGLVDEADVAKAVGKTLVLEQRTGGRPSPNVLLELLGGGGPVSPRQEKLLAKVVERLPDTIAQMKLPAEERQALLRLLRKPRPSGPAPPEQRVERALTIRGVLRAAESDNLRRGAWGYANADVILPERTAEEVFLSLPPARARGFDYVVVEVERVEHVKEVLAALQELGLEGH